MPEGELDQIVEQVRVFARVDPEHKLQIVAALQRKGHIVAMTGDGINDAPALKSANIGVAMGITGTDVSKEAADMVLTDDNFASIVKAIEEGRGIFDNIRKYLLYLLSSNAGELLTMFAGVMLAGLLGLTSVEAGLFLPLLAAQLLWINLVTDGPPALALGVDPRDPDVMEREPRARGAGILTAEDWWRLAAIGTVMMVGTLAVLDAYYPGGLFTLFATGTAPNAADETYARTMAFTMLMMFQLFNVYNCRSSWRSAFSGFFDNKWLLGAVALSLFTHALVIYVPFLQVAFHTVALSGRDWLVATGVASVLLIGMELFKLALRAKRRAASGVTSGRRWRRIPVPCLGSALSHSPEPFALRPPPGRRAIDSMRSSTARRLRHRAGMVRFIHTATEGFGDASKRPARSVCSAAFVLRLGAPPAPRRRRNGSSSARACTAASAPSSRSASGSARTR